MTAGLTGSIAIELTARLDIRSASGAQEAPPFVVFHTPPATPAAYIVVGVVGWISVARVRPPMLPGPSPVQAPRAAAAMSEGSIALCGGRGIPCRVEYRGICRMRSSAAPAPGPPALAEGSLLAACGAGPPG